MFIRIEWIGVFFNAVLVTIRCKRNLERCKELGEGREGTAYLTW